MITSTTIILNWTFKSMWIFLMIIATIYDVIRKVALNVYTFCTYYLHSLYGGNIRSMDIQYLEGCKTELSKIPKHLGVIVGSEKLYPEILSTIVVYALISDIEYITVYDSMGQFSLDDVKIPQYINSHKMNDGRFIWSMPNDKRNSGQLKYKNGMERSIEVRYLSYKAGKPLLANVCKELFEKTNEIEMQNTIKDKDNIAKLVDASLKKKLGNFPDVEIAIILDKNMCTFGLLPWHTGFTEFHIVEICGKYFSVQNFVNVLYKYSKCEQRFGK